MISVSKDTISSPPSKVAILTLSPSMLLPTATTIATSVIAAFSPEVRFAYRITPFVVNASTVLPTWMVSVLVRPSTYQVPSMRHLVGLAFSASSVTLVISSALVMSFLSS